MNYPCPLHIRPPARVKWPLMSIVVTCAICLTNFHPILGLDWLPDEIQLQEGEPVDYTWTRMKTHKNQLRIRNSQVFQNCFLSIFFSPAGVRLWGLHVQRSQWFWFSTGSDRASCVRCLNNHLIFLSLFVENMSEWGLFF